MSALSVEGLNFSYGRRQVLQDVGFEALQPGRLTALIGPNAAGKSTLFRLISGLKKPSSGTVRLGDKDLASVPNRERLKRVCFMPQFFTANAALTVFDVVMMAHKQLQGWHVSEEDIQTVAKALETSGIGHLSEAYISDLSGGQSQMVSVVQSLVRKSEVYLFDEPTSALDLRHQLDVLERIRQMVVDRNAVGIVALHDLNLAARFADHLVLLGKGRVLAEGAPADVFATDVLAQTYGVDIEVFQGPREDLLVHAYPS